MSPLCFLCLRWRLSSALTSEGSQGSIEGAGIVSEGTGSLATILGAIGWLEMTAFVGSTQLGHGASGKNEGLVLGIAEIGAVELGAAETL
jgi:hypothetical protein